MLFKFKALRDFHAYLGDQIHKLEFKEGGVYESEHEAGLRSLANGGLIEIDEVKIETKVEADKKKKGKALDQVDPLG